MRRLLMMFVVLLLALSAVRAQGPVSAPTAPRLELNDERLLHLFDFEEADDLNFEDMPRYWFIVGRSGQTADAGFLRLPLHKQLLERQGFPKYATVGFNRPQQEKGDHSLKLTLNGGSAAAFLQVGALAAVPRSDYVITARVRTDKLEHARARLLAYYVNASGERIAMSAESTPLITTDGQWQTVLLRLPGEFDDAAWIGMQAELLQPQHQPAAANADPAAAHGRHTVTYQDVRGDAWFDDIAVWQVPRVVVRTQSAINLITAPDRPELALEVRDLTGRELTALITVYDHARHPIARTSRRIGQGNTAIWRWSPRIERYGWYLIDFALHEPDGLGGVMPTPVARTLRTFIWMPRRQRIDRYAQRRFIVDAPDADVREIALLTEVLRAAGLSDATLSAWSAETMSTDVEQRQIDLEQAVSQLVRSGAHVTMSFSPTPRELRTQLDLDANDPLALFAHRRGDWLAHVRPVLLRQGQHTRRWQWGKPSAAALVYDVDLAAHLRAADDVLREFTPRPMMVLPWRLSQPRRAAIDQPGVEYAIDVPPSILPVQFGDHLEEWTRSPAPSYTLHLRVDDATRLTHERRVEDLALRMLHAWEHEPAGLGVERPWTVGKDKYSAVHPDPLLAVFSTVAHKLAGRRVVGRLPLGDGLQAMIFNDTTGNRGGMLAVWNESAEEEAGAVELYLGESPVISDVWGNEAKLERVNGRHRFFATRTPQFIEGIDARLARFRSMFSFESKLVRSSQGVHHHTIVLGNPWPRPIQGEFLITSPEGQWKFTPGRIPFDIDPGQSVSYPIEVTVPVSETSDRKWMIARVRFSAERDYDVNLRAPMELGLPDLKMHSGLTVQDGTGDAIATVFVTNTGVEPRSFYTFAIMSGYARQEAIVTSLDPGESVMRKFTFTKAGPRVHTTKIRVGVRDISGPAMMNHVLNADVVE